MFKKCIVCGRKLTSLKSMKRGAGQTCTVNAFEDMKQTDRKHILKIEHEIRLVRLKALKKKAKENK